MSEDTYVKVIEDVYKDGYALLKSYPEGHRDRQTVNELLQTILALSEEIVRLRVITMEGETGHEWRH